MDSNRRAILIGGLAATAEIGRAGRATTEGASVAQSGKEAPPPVDGTLRFDDESRAAAAEDFGHIVRRIPEGLLRPGSDQDVATIIRWAGDLRRKIAPRGQGHSVYGRAQTRDGYWQALEDALGRGFNPAWDVLEHGPDRAPNSTLGALAEAWKTQAAAYGKSGNPFAGQPDAPGARKPLHDELIELPNEDRGLPSNLSLAPALNVGMLGAAASASGNAWHFRLVASVRIIQREDGSLLAVELLGKSGNAAYDRLVLGQARSLGALRLGPPKQGLETLWAFETDFSQIPPLPIVGCALDDFIPKNCWRPLQKLVRSRVRLQAIY